MLLERDRELEAVAALVDAAADGNGGVLWIEGAAGIGKTSLLDHARARCATSGVRWLSARGGALERDLAFGVVRGLFEPLLSTSDPAERAELLAGSARLAAPVISFDDAGPDGPEASAGTLHGLYWLVTNLTDRGPVLLGVDDAHWADAPSLRALAYLARRIADLPVAMVVAARPAGPETDSRLFDAIRERSGILRPRPLSRDGSDALVRRRIPDAGEAAFAAACHDATGGNPFLLHALLAVLVADGVRPDAGGARAVAERAPEVVGTAVAERLRHAGPDADAVARAVAVLAGHAPLRHVAALTGLDPAAIADTAATLVEEGLLQAGRPLTFRHPLIEQAVANLTTPGERHRGHRAAARVLAEEGALPERVATHLLQTEALGDPEVVAALRAAARSALAKGAPESAVTYLRRAREEPPPPTDRPDVLFELGVATVRVSYTDGLALLEEARAAATDPVQRARIALELARWLRVTMDYRRALAVLDDALSGLGDGRPDLALEMEAEVVGLARRDPLRRAAALERTRPLRDPRHPATRGRAVLLANTALDALHEGDAERAVAMAGHALSDTLAHDPPDPGVLLPSTTVLIAAERLDEMLATCEAMIAGARRRGAIADFASASVLRAQTRYLQGHLEDAEADARLADDLAAEHRVHYARRYTQAWLVLTLVERGRLDEAAASLAASGVTMDLAYLLDARGHLRLAQGRAAEALEDFTECGRRLERRGVRHPGLMGWQANRALALYRLGRTEEAHRTAREATDAARRWSAPRALGVALRAEGLVTGSEEALRDAVDVLAPTAARLEHARALVDLGALLRRSNRRGDARDVLARGRELATVCGADALAERARDELVAAGARPRTVAVTGPGALTASERRVAELAAEGMSNRTVAQALFVTTKTVETHLGHVYRKLGVGGRDELAGALT
jgi:DNA-binding CsgD family transcriptional regulator/tetratricopeptide (TPR) repeat protein